MLFANEPLQLFRSLELTGYLCGSFLEKLTARRYPLVLWPPQSIAAELPKTRRRLSAPATAQQPEGGGSARLVSTLPPPPPIIAHSHGGVLTRGTLMLHIGCQNDFNEKTRKTWSIFFSFN